MQNRVTSHSRSRVDHIYMSPENLNSESVVKTAVALAIARFRKTTRQRDTRAAGQDEDERDKRRPGENRKFKFRETRARERAPSSGPSPPASRSLSAPTSFHSFGLFSRAVSATPPSLKRDETRKSADSVRPVPVSPPEFLNFKTRRGLVRFCRELPRSFATEKSCSDF